MSKDDSKNNGKPRFDMENATYGWFQELMDAMMDMDAGIRNNDKAAVHEARAARDRMFAAVTIYVPQEWLRKDAPPTESIEWTPETFAQYLRWDAMGKLNTAIQEEAGN